MTGGINERASRAAVGVGAALLLTATVLVDVAEGQAVGCGAVITRDTRLSGDVGPCPGEGIVIAADNITVDLGGHRVIGDPQARTAPDKAGIILRQVTRVTVRNGTVERFDAGVVIMGGGRNTVRRVTARDNVNYRMVTGRDSQPEDIVPNVGPYCELGDGITAFGSNDNVIEQNLLYGNGPFSAVSLVFDSDRNRVANNDIRDNDVMNETPAGTGTVCGSTANGPIPDPPPFCCDAWGRHSQDVGVRIEGPGAERNVVERNLMQRNGLAGVLITGFHMEVGTNNGFNVVRRNRIYQTGLRVHDSTGDGTEAYRSSGIQLHHSGPPFIHVSYGNLIEGNESSGNFASGIEVTGPTPGSGVVGEHGNTVRNNVVNDNLLDGIHLAEGTVETEVTGNRGRGNGWDPARVREISEGDVYANYDGVDGGDYNPGCGSNRWSRNRVRTVNQPCVAGR
ncbi:MAG TPA: right-handed parallel beta-helix repeat-containing protein [Acidimicrobiales bacterium]|nr:right-handed parallel beta-helix repeat-containing protein [Acidimicrobiales bacterium]